MTNGYAKIFSTILASSIWTEDDRTRLVWITMLVMSDGNGIVKEVKFILDDTHLELVASLGAAITGGALNRVRGAKHYVKIINSGGATGLVQGGNLTTLQSIEFKGENGAPCKPISFNGTGTVLNIYTTV